MTDSPDQRWLDDIDDIAANAVTVNNRDVVAQQIRDLLTRETARAYQAGLAEQDPPPPGMVDRMRQLVATATTRLVYGTAEDLEQAAAEMAHIDKLVTRHSPGLRRAIGPALLNAEATGTGWIRIDATCAPDQPVDEIFDWTISSPDPTTIEVRR